MPGTLYIVATPIGNLSDLSPRIKNTFASVDLILAEDTRVTIKLLNHLGIKKKMLSCHEFNEHARLKIIRELASLNQSAALVSDAGMPLISDPGNEIVREAIQCGMTTIPIPGPSANLLALVASGLPCDRFVFEGFLPEKMSSLKNRLTELESERRTIVLYESPHRLIKTLLHIQEILGDRQICVAKELTKLHEHFYRGNISEVMGQLDGEKILGEYVIVLSGNNNAATAGPSKEELEKLISRLLSENYTVKTIVKDLTANLNVKRSEIYELALALQKNPKTSQNS